MVAIDNEQYVAWGKRARVELEGVRRLLRGLAGMPAPGGRVLVETLGSVGKVPARSVASPTGAGTTSIARMSV